MPSKRKNYTSAEVKARYNSDGSIVFGKDILPYCELIYYRLDASGCKSQELKDLDGETAVLGRVIVDGKEILYSKKRKVPYGQCKKFLLRMLEAE